MRVFLTWLQERQFEKLDQYFAIVFKGRLAVLDIYLKYQCVEI